MSELSIGPADPRPVETTIHTANPTQFFSALQWVEAKTRETRHAELPAPLRMIRCAFYMELELDNGIERFLTAWTPEDKQQQLGVYAAEFASFCESIGATSTAEYISAACALFPRGKLPATYTEINSASYKLREKQPAAFTDLDDEYRGGVRRELSSALRKWLRANQAEIESLIGQPPPAKPDLGAVIATTDKDPWLARVYFMHALETLAREGRATVPQGKWPESARMITVLNGMWSAVNSSGLDYVFDWAIGNHYADAQRWAATIGAKKTASYLATGAKLFPKGKVPGSPEARAKALEKLPEARRDRAITDIDRKFREDVIHEIPDSLRKYVRANRKAIEADLSRLSRKTGKTSAASDEPLGYDQDILEHYARMRELRAELIAEGKMKERPTVAKPGDVLEFKAGRKLAYIQVSHEHAFSTTRGPVVRILPGTFAKRPTAAALKKLVAGESLFFSLFDVDEAVRKRQLKAVATLPVPKKDAPFPTFLYYWGKTKGGKNVWRKWDGGENSSGLIIGPLTDEQKSSPYANASWAAWDLRRAIDDGWRPAQEYASWDD